MAITLNVADREGLVRTVGGEESDVLMRILRDLDFGIEGTCGGECSCGTCQVFASASRISTLDEAGEDETYMIEAQPSSRLACKINLAPERGGLDLEIGPQL